MGEGGNARSTGYVQSMVLMESVYFDLLIQDPSLLLPPVFEEEAEEDLGSSLLSIG